ncbi:hypothetical protein GS492_09770 [Rhodococcus hoagii]|nr:hypothetical protein [Prescottella equi]
MARTYPAKRSRIATDGEVALHLPELLGGDVVYVRECEVCKLTLAAGDRVVDGTYSLVHARCADAGEALP